jgi:putative flippase GtrA
MLGRRTLGPFVIVGALATGLQYVILIALVNGGGVPAPIASAVGFSSSALANYALNRHFTFASRRAHVSALPRFLIVATSGLVINTGIVWLAATRAGWYYLLAQIIATLAVLLWTYTFNRHWTFAGSE